MVSGRTEDPGLHGLVIDLGDLRRRGEQIHHASLVLPAEFLESALHRTDARVSQPGAITLDVQLQHDGTVLVRGQLEAGFEVPCARCLEPAVVEVGEPLCSTYLPSTDARAAQILRDPDEEEEIHLEEQDLEVYVYRGQTLDLREAIAEQIALAYPMRVLCSRGQSCRGLCTGCGTDLNTVAPGAGACTGCGLPLHVVSQAPADRIEASEGDPEPAWKAALRKLQRE